MHNLQEQLGCSFIFARRDGDQGLKPAHTGISSGRVREDSGPGLLLGMTLVAIGVRGLSTTDL